MFYIGCIISHIINFKQRKNIMKESIINAPKLDIETEDQYILFVGFLNMGRTRKISEMADGFGCSERTLYAYAKKFNWFERARIEDKKMYEREINEEKLRSAEIKLEKIRSLNSSQDLANTCVGFLTLKSKNKHFSFYLDCTGSEFTTSEKLGNITKILKAIECYTRICISIDKHLEKLYNEDEDVIHTEESLLELNDFYENELTLLEKTIGEIEFDNIYQELEYIENGHKLQETKKEIG